jgi:ABC-type polysaccharide/polyol phosphate export permease
VPGGCGWRGRGGVGGGSVWRFAGRLAPGGILCPREQAHRRHGLSTDELQQVGQLQQTRQTSWRARARLIWAFAVRDLRARFTATSLGLVWTLIVPIATVIIYSTVFSVIFRAQAPPMGNGDGGVFAAWFFVGLVVWNTFSQVTMGGMGSILGMGGMLQKVYIPSFVPVLASAVTVAVEKLIEAGVMLFVLLLLQNVGWTWLLFPFVLALLWVFASALSYCLAVAIVFFRDTGQIVGIVMQMWFFLTPVMYPVDMIPVDWNGIPLRRLLALNPMADFVGITRALLYELRLPPLGPVLYCAAWTAALVVVAAGVYRKRGRDVSEAI